MGLFVNIFDKPFIWNNFTFTTIEQKVQEGFLHFSLILSFHISMTDLSNIGNQYQCVTVNLTSDFL